MNQRKPIVQNLTNGISHVTNYSDVTLDKIYKGDYQKPGTLTAQLRQTVTTVSKYPSKKTSSELQANLYANADFGFEEQTFEAVETRIAWILVPEKVDETDLRSRLLAANASGCTIYKVLANAPILDENQKYAINNPEVDATIDTFANAQAVRYPDTEEMRAEGKANRLILDKDGKVQYRRTFYWNTPQEDFDSRGKGEAYLSAELKAELSGASQMQGQTI